MSSSPLFQTLIFSSDSFQVLDQTLLPTTVTYHEITSIPLAISSIKEMKVRGAPLIAVVALQAIRYELRKIISSLKSPEEVLIFLEKSINDLKASRPTAVNLSNDLNDLLSKAKELKDPTPDSLNVFIQSFVEHNYKEYENACELISKHGADLILEKMDKMSKKMVHIMTICNTGKLATPGDGTALGIIREIHRRHRLKKLYIPETRPYNQGSRLTASEAVFDKLPGVLISDSMAAMLMHENKVDCVIVGADRVVKNGTTANKIGTYSLAVLAHHHHIPFYVACPESTIDKEKLVGSEIVIEERPGEELKKIGNIWLAPKEIDYLNPAFDLTYPHLIEKIITEKGEFKFDQTIGDWELLNAKRIEYILKHKFKLFDYDDPLKINDVADGNLNLVYCVRGKKQALCVKQALPYVKCVGPQWELTLKRALFESEALRYQGWVCPENVPHFYAFNEHLALLVMEFLDHPHIILRKGLIHQIKYEGIGHKIGVFIAKTCYFSSGLSLKADYMRERMSFWNQNSLCSLTEQVIFSDPYVESSLNKWNTPYLDEVVKGIKSDEALIKEIVKLRSRFVILKQALLHGDLHTGSIMVTESGSAKVIDSEFAFYGPIGFDVGAFLSNLLLNYFSHRGNKPNEDYEEWVLNEISNFWKSFVSEWMSLWNDKKNRKGDEYPEILIDKSEGLLKEIQEEYIRDVWKDSLGFTGAKMIRRIVGVAHVQDLDGIVDLEKRAICEKKALKMARKLIVDRNNLKDIEEVIEIARKINQN